MSLIAGIAILGLSVGVAVLIVVLSVMNGFEEELRTRILSLTAHATLSGLDGRIAHWRPDLDRLGRFPGVEAAAPYVEAQGMMTHDGKSSGVLLRGVVPADERRVSDVMRTSFRGLSMICCRAAIASFSARRWRRSSGYASVSAWC